MHTPSFLIYLVSLVVVMTQNKSGWQGYQSHGHTGDPVSVDVVEYGILPSV